MYINKLESILKNKTNKIPWYFEIWKDHLNQASRSVNKNEKVKRSFHLEKLVSPTIDWKFKKKRKYRQILRTCYRAEKITKHESDRGISCNCYIIKEWFLYINHSSLIIFYHSVWLGFGLFGLKVQVHSHWVQFYAPLQGIWQSPLS